MKLLNWVASMCLLTALGCGKDIGDACKSVNECITTDTNRLCLTEDGEGFPGGYCTKFNCGGTNACPEEAACVAYRYTLGGGGCDSDEALSRLQRNYCMFRCENDDDCRSGYKCLSANGDNPLGATIIDGHVGAKVCALEYYEPTEAPERDSEVCEPEGLIGANSSGVDASPVTSARSDAGPSTASSLGSGGPDAAPDSSSAADAAPNSTRAADAAPGSAPAADAGPGGTAVSDAAPVSTSAADAASR